MWTQHDCIVASTVTALYGSLGFYDDLSNVITSVKLLVDGERSWHTDVN